MDKQYDSSELETKDIGQEIERLQRMSEDQRKSFSRHWYDNNFFDDGHHFRFISRTTGRIVDLSEKATIYTPMRAIPKASRQIRGMANLMLSSDFVPIIFPKKVSRSNYPDPLQFQEVWKQVKEVARRAGHWVSAEWDNQELDTKLAEMVLLAMKHSISFMQIWWDDQEEEMKTQVYDAFDIYLSCNNKSIYESPYIIKVIPKTIKEIKSNPIFDKDQLEEISADNKYASDDIKEAYLASSYGVAGRGSDSTATLLLKEAFIKEYLNDDNKARIKEQDNADDILKGKDKGDVIIRHIFTAGKVWLYDQYEDLPDYPFIDLRLEPGKIYQTPQIERFIPSNKSLDSVVSRLERWVHTMNVGIWLKQKDENFQINNVAGGLVAEYASRPPAQMTLASPGQAIFNFIDLLGGIIEEQGVTTSALGRIPKGVKAWGAIESLKASEFANLYIPIKMLKKTLKTMAEKMLDIADKYIVSPREVYRMDKGEPDYFDVIGQSGVDVRKKIKEEIPEDIIPLSKDYKVEIEIQSGLGYTEEGKKGRMMELADFMIKLAEIGMLSPDAVKLVVNQLMEVFKFGPTGEMMEALDNIQPPQTQPFSPEQQQQVKVAMLEVIRDLQKAGGGMAQEQQPKKETKTTKTLEMTKEGPKTKEEVQEVIK